MSYYVQKLFSEFQGVRYIETSVKTGDSDPHDHGIAASATCQDNDCTQLAFKVMQPLPVYVHYTVQLLKSVTLFMSCVVPTLTCMTAADFQFRLPVAVLILASPPFTLCSWVAPVLFLFRHIHPAHPFSAPPPPPAHLFSASICAAQPAAPVFFTKFQTQCALRAGVDVTSAKTGPHMGS